MFGNPGAPTEILGLPPGLVVRSIAIVGFVIGIAWLWRITRVDDDGDHWRYRR
jgi:hypothetical protein